jgi:methylase of polypeptide subunit release factors
MLGFRDQCDYRRAREVLAAADFTAGSIGRVLRREAILTMPTSDVPQVLRRTRNLDPLDVLIRLLFVGLPVPASAVRRALAPMPLESWIAAGLLSRPDGDDQVEPLVQIWPVADLLLAVDLPWRRSAAPPADFVVPPGPLTLELANTMIRHRCTRMLDLGTGSGSLALEAARFAQEVVATDKNPRAIAFTHFNAQLNGIENVRCLVGDLFEPVADEQFQLVLCNPPFVISPTERYLYRDSGQRGDAFCRQVIRAAVDRLETGGFCQMTANVAHCAQRPWKADLESWFEGLGCDVLVLVQRTEDASDYATNWILATESKAPERVAQRYEEWMAYFEREGIEAVSYLFITLRRSAGGPVWTQIDDPPCRITGPCGDELAWFFRCRDLVGSPSAEEDFLNQRAGLGTCIRVEQEYAPAPEGLQLRQVRVEKTGGLQYPLVLHPNVAGLLAACDGRRTFRQLLDETIRCLGADQDQARPLMLPVLRFLIERGVLTVKDTAHPLGRNTAFIRQA